MDEKQVSSSAALLIVQHGERAATVAANNFIRFEKAGDIENAEIWTAILIAIRELTTTKSSASEPRN